MVQILNILDSVWSDLFVAFYYMWTVSETGNALGIIFSLLAIAVGIYATYLDEVD